MTIGDSIRRMSDEELAKFLAGIQRRKRIETIRELSAKGLIPTFYVVDVPAISEMAQLKILKEQLNDNKGD